MAHDSATQAEKAVPPEDGTAPAETNRNRGVHPHVRRTFLAATAAAAAFVTVVAAVSMGAYFWARTQIEVIPPPPDARSGTGPEDIAGVCDERACNYLLLGSDSRAGLTPKEQVQFGTNEDIGGENRSDTIILVHTEPEQKRAIFLSFPRDLWVDIPGVGEGRINTAFEGGIRGGGAQLVARTVRNLTGLRVNHVLYVDLAGFQGLVDALGGVDMCVPFAMVDEKTGLDIPAGCQHFDGATALAYVRTRNQPCDRIPDFARIGRQQQFMRAVVSELLAPTQLLRLPSLVPELLGNLVVDEGLRNPAELVYLAGTLEGVNTGAADFRSVPSVPKGIYVNGQYLSVVEAVQPQATQLFERIEQGRPLGELGAQLSSIPPTPANISVAVVDRNAGTVAEDVYGVLTESGFNTAPGVVRPREVRSPVGGSAILYGSGLEAEAEVVASYLGDLELVPAPEGALPGGVDVAVVVNAAYRIPPPDDGATVECPT
jgi:LCP family protein required for cell wall assembly